MEVSKPASSVSAGLLTGSEAARFLAISESLLQKLKSRNEIPCVRIGRSVRYYLPDLVRWIEERKSLSTSG